MSITTQSQVRSVQFSRPLLRRCQEKVPDMTGPVASVAEEAVSAAAVADATGTPRSRWNSRKQFLRQR
ncbi:Apolipoprotein N-acyltransferase, partial [Frankliniella fusca]